MAIIILENDKVCHTCYKSHLIILQTSNCPSTDADLEQLINDLSKQLSSFTVGSGKDVTDKAMNATALEVAKLLLENYYCDIIAYNQRCVNELCAQILH